MVSENQEKKPKILLIGLLILIVIIIIVVFVFGVRGIIKIIGTVGTIAIFLVLGFLLAWAFWYMFLKKHRFDITYVNKQKLIQACKINNQKGLLTDLYISGDQTHSRVKIGKILGYCRIQILAKNNLFTEEGLPVMRKKRNQEGELEQDYTLEAEEQDVFTIKRNIFQGMFTDPLVIRVSPRDHDDLVGDVTIKGFSLLPMSEYLFLNSDYLDVRKIDFAILKEAQRGIMFENLRDMKTIVDKAIGLDALHKKEIEKKDLVEIPQQP